MAGRADFKQPPGVPPVNNPGFPLINYGIRNRNLGSHGGLSQSDSPSVLYIPRYKYTYLVEFQINPIVAQQVENLTNVKDFIQQGRLFTHLRNIDHPKIQIQHDTLRSYNKYIKIPMKVEYQPATMTFDDDSASVVLALWKEYLGFYSYLGSVGQNIATGNNTNLVSSNEINSFQLRNELTGEEQRSSMNTRPSLGMKLKPNDTRHFFDSIVIYDLGTEPQGINVYWYHRPVITNWDHSSLDRDDRTGRVDVNITMEYEGYYFALGVKRSQIKEIFQELLDFEPLENSDTPEKPGIARMRRSRQIGSQAVDLVSKNPITPSTSDNNRVLSDPSGANDPLGITQNEEFLKRNRIPPEELERSTRFLDPELGQPSNPTNNVTSDGTVKQPTEVEPFVRSTPIIPDTKTGLQRDITEISRQRSAIFGGETSLTQAEGQKRIQELSNREFTLVEQLNAINAAEKQILPTSTKTAIQNIQRQFPGTAPNPKAIAIPNRSYPQIRSNTITNINRLESINASEQTAVNDLQAGINDSQSVKEQASINREISRLESNIQTRDVLIRRLGESVSS